MAPTYQEVVDDLAARYGLRIDRTPFEQLPQIAMFSAGPRTHTGISFHTKTVYIGDFHTTEEVELHELMHLICGEPSLDIDEAFVLMQAEWEIAKWMNRRIRSSDFMAQVAEYQENTSFRRTSDGRYHEVRASDRRSEWWKAGIERAQRLGVLDENRAPTFRCANWHRINITSALRWSAETDINWRRRAPRREEKRT